MGPWVGLELERAGGAPKTRRSISLTAGGRRRRAGDSATAGRQGKSC